MKRFTLLLSAMLLACATSLWAEGTSLVLFHETFGDNSSSARAWDDSYSVKSGVSAVYQNAAYTITNAKQGKNSTGYGTPTTSGLNQSTANADAVFIVGPLSVADYQNLGVTYYWKAGSIKATYTTKLYYSTDGENYTEVEKTSGTGATTFVQCVYSLPEAAQSNTLYLKVVFNTSNTQAIIDEFELTGESASSITLQSVAMEGSAKSTYKMGEKFDRTGLTLIAVYSDDTRVDVTTQATWTITPETIAESTTSVEVKAAYQGKEATTNVNVTVLTLQALALSGEPKNKTYYLGETFNPEGLVVTATYSDGTTTADVTDQVSWEIDPATFTTLGIVSVDVMASIGQSLMSDILTISNIEVVEAGMYAKITNSAQLANGQHIIIVNTDTTKALSATQNENNRGITTFQTTENGLVIPNSSVEVIKLNAVDSKWELQVKGGYLYAIYGKNYLRTQTANTNAGLWTIVYTDDVVSISSEVSNENSETETRYLRYNSVSSLFSCYTEGQKDIAIFARQYTVTVETNDESMGTVTGGGNYFENNVAKLVATPKEGCKFTGWSNIEGTTTATQDLTVKANITITANFAKGETAVESATIETSVVKAIENGQLIIIRDGVKYNAMGVRLQ
ncbi:MAG: bacterial Ig-like domain-containing protein [Paludibacteraceae bacterium]